MIPTSPFNALVVDDDVLIRQAVTRALSREGFVCYSAADGQVALEKLKETTFDIAICDLRMPEVNGHELIVSMLAMEARPAIIVLTGLPEPRLVRDLFFRGVEDVMAKPANFDVLVAKAKALAERQRTISTKSSPLRPPEGALSQPTIVASNGISAGRESLNPSRVREKPKKMNHMDRRRVLSRFRSEKERQWISSRLATDGRFRSPRTNVQTSGSALSYATISSEASATTNQCQRVEAQISQACRDLEQPPQDYDGFLRASGDALGIDDLAQAIRVMPSVADAVLSLANRILFHASEQLKIADCSQSRHETPILHTYRHAIAILLFLLGCFVGLSTALLLLP